MLYFRILLGVLFVWVIWYIYIFFKTNKKQISLIFKRAIYFYSNPMIKQTLIVSTLKFLFKIIRKSLFKF